MPGIVYIIGTPIGNLGDMTPRAIDTLKNVDFIAAEDTRVTIKLLNRFEIKKPMISCREQNIKERSREIIGRVMGGESCGVVTDAGMPCISDPGEVLVSFCHEAKVDVRVVPGPTAAMSALAVSGLPTSRFSFEGFLSVNKKNRAAHLEEIKNNKYTMIFYEAPHKLKRTLGDFLITFGDRKIAVIKELTKIHETIMLTTLKEAVAHFEEVNPRGEFVLVVDGTGEQSAHKFTLLQATEMARELRADGDSPSTAAKKAAEMTGFKKSDIYKSIMS